ncbi:Transcriptional activator of proteases prtT [Apiospora kogelbergensis]|uniref:Transcriptional activator of proteases prtT n=1 Tax=Apiospora kogelbergensis TaxID=1337665 RepID=A0AAW0QTE3_9PEZI
MVEKLANNDTSSEVAQQMVADESDDPLVDEDITAILPAKSAHPDSSGHWGVVMDLDSGPGVIPGFHLTKKQLPEQSSLHEDFIARNVVTLDSATCCFEVYRDRLDHFPYRILNDQTTVTLESVRRTSTLLTASVCSVGALHSNSADFEIYYREFLQSSAQQSLSKHNTTDDVRALCIGAFWLSDLSWSLVGAAVRIATELQLHRSFHRALKGNRQHYLRARLYYLVYACDHHFSVAYGRPPMTRECEAVRNAREFLKCEFATEDDARLVSQVLRWSICSNIFDTFGVDIDRPISESDIPHLRRFGIALDSIRAEWVDRFSPNAHVGNYPRKGVGLQYNFAKLYLCSHAFRGVNTDEFTNRPPEVAPDLEEMTNSAVLAASAIVRAVVSDPEIQGFLDGLPIYFDTMIAFAAVFLLKVSTKYGSMVQINLQGIRHLLRRLLTTLKKVTSSMHSRHLLVGITAGIESLLHRCGIVHNNYTIQEQDTGDVTATHDSVSAGQDPDPTTFSMEEYDFLFNPDMDFSLEFLNQDGLV